VFIMNEAALYLFVGDGDDFGVVLSDLLVQQLHVCPRRQALNLHGGESVFL